jgi:hypothetical protein
VKGLAVLILKDEWKRLEVYDGLFTSVKFGAEQTLIVVESGLEVYAPDSANSFWPANATIVLKDVASYKYHDCGYQRVDAQSVEWDEPTIRAEQFRPPHPLDGVIHVGGGSLWTRNGSSSCDISVWARHMEIWTDYPDS